MTIWLKNVSLARLVVGAWYFYIGMFKLKQLDIHFFHSSVDLKLINDRKSIGKLDANLIKYFLAIFDIFRFRSIPN